MMRFIVQLFGNHRKVFLPAICLRSCSLNVQLLRLVSNQHLALHNGALNSWDLIIETGSGPTVHCHLILVSCLVYPWLHPSLPRLTSIRSALLWIPAWSWPGTDAIRSPQIARHKFTALCSISDALMSSLSEISQLTKCER